MRDLLRNEVWSLYLRPWVIHETGIVKETDDGIDVILLFHGSLEVRNRKRG